MTEYIVCKRFNGIGISGKVNISAGTRATCENDMISVYNKAICRKNSENAHTYFSINADGCGMQRGELIRNICTKLSKVDAKQKDRWKAIEQDDIACSYRNEAHSATWLWKNEFYEAPIVDLQHIFNLIR